MFDVFLMGNATVHRVSGESKKGMQFKYMTHKVALRYGRASTRLVSELADEKHDRSVDCGNCTKKSFIPTGATVALWVM